MVLEYFFTYIQGGHKLSKNTFRTGSRGLIKLIGDKILKNDTLVFFFLTKVNIIKL